nr:acyltransferase family protein [Kineosporia mesophila]
MSFHEVVKQAPVDAPPAAGRVRTAPTSSHRNDIQGLRAVAVLTVLLYHTGLGPSGGFIGVDVFFVLSGFLITGLLVREHDRTGRISLPTFWARRLRRLLPASALVLIVTCVVSRWYLPPARWESIGSDAVAASTYIVNWRLAASSVDYLAEGAAASPLQHYWSLSIEEQFYVVWPLLMSLVLLARTRKVAIAVIGLITAGSFALALATYSAQTYFTTQTRVWELAAGALCAVAMASRPAWQNGPERPRWTGLLSWAGLVLIFVCLFVVKPTTMWPGPLTAMVIAGTVLVLGFGDAPNSVKTVLALRPLTWIGDISYSLYLWHWPLVVFAERDGTLTPQEGWSIVGISVVLATATYYLVEQPTRKAKLLSRTRVGIATGLALVVIGAGTGQALTQAKSVDDPVNALGAAAPTQLQQSATALAPRPEEAAKDNGEIYQRDCPSNYANAAMQPCVFDYRTAGVGPRVLAVGDSKMGQWMPTLIQLARRHHWQLTSITKAGCAFSDTRRYQAPNVEYSNCVTWNDSVKQEALKEHPDLLITTQLEYYATVRNGVGLQGEENRQEMIRGLNVRLHEMQDAGIPTVTIAETPRMLRDMPECVSTHLKDLMACSRSRPFALRNSGMVKAASTATDTPVIDLNDKICAAERCPAVMGDMLMYRDDHHLTATYARTLTPYFEEQLGPALVRYKLRQTLLGTAPATVAPPSATQG